MTIQEMIDVLDAYKMAKVIEVSQKDKQAWIRSNNPCWNFNTFDYRVKPEPREGWVHPDQMLGGRPINFAWIKVREVLE